MRLKNNKLNTGVSPVIGVILMVVITVVLGAIVANYMLAFGESSDQQNPAASTSFDQTFDPNGQVVDESELSTADNVEGNSEWTYDAEADELTRTYDDDGDSTAEVTSTFEWDDGNYVDGDGDTAQSEGAFSDVNDFRVQTGEFTVEVQLTRAANIDFVQVGGQPSYVDLSSTDGDALAGSGTEDSTMDSVGDVITVENIGDGDRFNVVGSLQGNEQVLNRYEVRQR